MLIGNSPKGKCKQLRNIFFLFFLITNNLRNENSHNAMTFVFTCQIGKENL